MDVTRTGFVAALLLGAVPALGQEHAMQVILKGDLTTSSELFPHSDASDPVLRAESLSLTDSFGFGMEGRYRFPESNVAVGVSTDYLRTTTSNPLVANDGESIPVEDGYAVTSLEVTGYFIIPASGPTFGIFMGGGAGAYFGHRLYRIAGTEAATIDRQAGFGIHVLGGVSYKLAEWFSVLAEMKFRDLQFSSTNAFGVSQVMYNGSVVPLPTQSMEARVHTDGIIFQLGAAFGL